MTVRIRIPSSEEEPSNTPVDWHRSSSRPRALLVAGVLALAILAALVGSVTNSADPPESSLSAPNESEDPAASTMSPVVPGPWGRRALPGNGEILAMGAVGDKAVAVIGGPGRPETYIWERAAGAWTLAGSPALEAVESAVVMDDRVLLVSDLQGRPTVWEWVDGSARYLFQPTSGSVVGTWSVGGRLIVAVMPAPTRESQDAGRSERDSLWVESSASEFEEIELIGIEVVLAAGGDTDAIAVGGRNTEGRAAVGFIEGGRLSAMQLPAVPEKSTVTDLAGGSSSLMALVSVADRPMAIGEEIRSAARGWERVAEPPDLVGIEVIDDLVVGVSHDGTLVSYDLNGVESTPASTPAWDFGSVNGLDVLGDEPVIYGQSRGVPTFDGPAADEGEVVMPVGMWRRYHSQASDGFRLVHIGSLEFAVRGGRLFHRSWDGEPWQAALGDLAVYGVPTILETDRRFVLVPAARGGLWTSDDGRVWNRLEGSEQVRIEQSATNGDVVVGLTRVGVSEGPSTDVTVIDAALEITERSLPVHLVGVGWEPGVGFFASVGHPGSGHATSSDGTVWLVEESTEAADRVVGFEGMLHRSSGVGVDGTPAGVPTPEGSLSIYDGGTRTWIDRAGTTWIHDGSDWLETGLGVLDGLPQRPHRLLVVGSRVFAMIDSVDGGSETYVLELD